MLEARQYSPFEQLRVQLISGSLTKARNDFVTNEQKNTDKEIGDYELEQDLHLYQELARHKNESGYEEVRDGLNAFTKMQVQTHIGERLHVGISKYEFKIKKGEIWSENAGEPMLNMIKRGRNYRKRHGKPIDWRRENAEVVGFEQIQRVLGSDLTPEGTMMLTISPPGEIKKGSIYKKNFYDVYQKTKDGVVAIRYTSGLTPAESHEKVRKFDWRYGTNEVSTDYDFLSRPIRLDTNKTPFETPQEVHEYMHKEHDFMRQEEFRKVINVCAPLITSYINTLCNNPEDLWNQNKIYRATVNLADEVVEFRKKQTATAKTIFFNSSDKQSGEDYIRPWIPSQVNIDRLAAKKIRQVDTGCGSSGDKDKPKVTSSSTYSLVEFESLGSNGGGKSDYDFDDIGDCVACSGEDVPVGPCGICESCDAKMGGKASRIL